MKAGLRCASCDPVVRSTTYGASWDPFVRVVDVWDAKTSTVLRSVFARVCVEDFVVTCGFAKAER